MRWAGGKRDYWYEMEVICVGEGICRIQGGGGGDCMEKCGMVAG